MSILVITTGGTIGAVAHDKLAHPDSIQKMPEDGSDNVAKFLKSEFQEFPVRCLPFEHRDSNHIDDAYRRRLFDRLSQQPERSVLITHGTDTLLKTAEYLFKRRQEKIGLDKVVVITGSLVPLACGPVSDGYQNLHYALQQLLDAKLPTGIYVVLSDYVNADKREGWVPRLYDFQPGLFEKYYDPEDSRRSRLVLTK